jgi:HEPN domain-containing protein
VTPESADFLAKAKRTVARAERVLRAGEPVDAARDAYIAALSAARAIIFEKTGKSPKTHNGSRALFLLLISQGLNVPRDVAQFLEDGFALKTRAD